MCGSENVNVGSGEFDLNLYAAVCWFGKRKWCKKTEKLLKPWQLIWEYLVRAIQWIPTWQVLDVFFFQKSFRPCSLEESRLSIGRVKNQWEFDCI